nr:Hsp70 family protein [Rhodococcus sp. (in: high G+C Gram-positive bacteria)]
MTVLLGVSMGAHAVRMALPRNAAPVAPVVSSSRVLEAPQQLFFRNQVIDTVDDDVEYLAAESISALAAESEPHMATGVAYRDAHQADTLHRALEHQHLHNYHLVHEVEAVVEYLIASGEAAGHSTVALYDLGSSGLNVSVVDLADRRVITTRRSTEFSGDLFDAILRDNQLERLGKASDASDIDLFTRRCRVAKERLSGNDAVCLPDESGMILLSRDSYETLITDEVDRSIEFAREVLISANVPIDAVVLIGGGSRIPLVHNRVGPSLDLPALTPVEPESVAARGAALSARPLDGQRADRPTPSARAPIAAAAGAGVAGVTAPRPTDATPTIAISRSDLPSELPPLDLLPTHASASVATASVPTASVATASVATAPARPAPSRPVPLRPASTPTSSPAPQPGPLISEAPTRSEPEAEDSSAPAGQRHFALKNVYWLDADYEDDDGEDESVRKRRLVRSWSIVGVAAAAVIAVSGFLLTRPSAEPAVVDTAVTQAPATTAAATTPAVTTPAPAPSAVPLVPPPSPAPATTTEAPAAPETTVVQQQPENSPTQEAPQAPVVVEPAPAPAPVPAPAPAPAPLIPGIPGFTLPTIPPLFPPAP